MGNVRTEGGCYLPKAMLLPGASGFMMPGPVLFSQHPTIATAVGVSLLGASGASVPDQAFMDPLALGPGKGLCSYLLGSS